MSKVSTVSQEEHKAYKRLFPALVHREQFAGNIFGYWASQLPLDKELDRLRFKMQKSAYDEMRHKDICEKMVKRFAGEDGVEEMYNNWDPYDNWMTKMTKVFTEGMEDHIEFLCTIPLAGDRAGLYTFQSFAECSSDPLWTDAAESIVEDEKLHSSLPDEFLPIAVERHGDEAVEKIERALETWLPAVLGIQGHPVQDAEGRQYLIDSGIIDVTIDELYDQMMEEVHEVMDPLGVDVPDLDENDYLRSAEVLPYCMDEYVDRIVRGEV